MRCFYIEEIKYLDDCNYLICKTLEFIDERFIDFVYEEAFFTPFKWLDMMEYIFNNKSINYVIDSTSIISTYLIDLKNLEYFYLFLKKLLRNGFVEKIIYRNEFIIVHYSNLFIKNSLCLFNSWTCLVLYKSIKLLNIDGECYLFSRFKNSSKEEVVDLVFENKGNFTLISSNPDLCLPFYFNVYNIIIYDMLYKINNPIIKFTFNKDELNKVLNKLFL